MNPEEEYGQLATELETLRGNTARTEAQTTRMREVMGRMTELEPIVREGVEADRLARTAADLGRSAGRPSERENPAGDQQRGEGGAEAETRRPNITFARKITTSDEMRAYQEHHNPTRVPVGSFYWSEIEREDGTTDYARSADRYALVSGSGLTTIVTPDHMPGIHMGQLVQPTVRDAFTNSPTQSNLVTFVREDVDSSSNAAAGFDPNGGGGPSEKPESTIAFEEDDAPVRTIATVIPVTDQIIDDVPGFESLLNGRLLDFLAQAEDDALLNGDGTNPNILGLLETPGIQELDDTYFAGVTIPDTGEPNEDINRLTHAVTQIRQVGLANPSYIMLSPAALDYFLMATDGNRNYLAGNPFTTDNIARFRGLPIIVTNKLDDEQAVVGDGTMAEVRDRMQARVDVGYIDKQFVKNQKTLRAEERLAFAVIRPAAHALVTLKLTA